MKAIVISDGMFNITSVNKLINEELRKDLVFRSVFYVFDAIIKNTNSMLRL